jgi:hypothetical protein
VVFLSPMRLLIRGFREKSASVVWCGKDGDSSCGLRRARQLTIIRRRLERAATQIFSFLMALGDYYDGGVIVSKVQITLIKVCETVKLLFFPVG